MVASSARPKPKSDVRAAMTCDGKGLALPSGSRMVSPESVFCAMYRSFSASLTCGPSVAW